MAFSVRYSCRTALSSTLRNYSTVAEKSFIQQETIQSFRTNVDNPIDHNESHLSRFYVMPSEVTNNLFRYGGLPKLFQKQVKTFTENAIMVREPALEVISYLQRTDYSKAVNKYVLYGELGSGKTLSLAHILHFGLITKKVLIHIPWIPDWFRKPKEVAPSKIEGIYNLPVHAAEWLEHFKQQNKHLLSELDIKLSKDTVWNVREQNLAGSPLMELIDFGIVRAKYACEVVDILLNELKLACTMGKCVALVVIDGFNSFFGDDSKVKGVDFKLVMPNKISLTSSFMNITQSDWCNGAIVLSVDECAVHAKSEHESIFPRYLLGKEGFDHLDPFLPVKVSNFSSDEFASMMEYYKDRKWVRNISEAGQRELELLSNKNPFNLMRYTSPL